MYNNTETNHTDGLFENMTEEERRKLMQKRAEAQFVYEQMAAQLQKIENEQEEMLHQFLDTITVKENVSEKDVLKSFALLPPEKHLSLKTTAKVLSAFADRLVSPYDSEIIPELNEVCKKLANAHKAITLTDKKGRPISDKDNNLMLDNLKSLYTACDNYKPEDADRINAHNSTVADLGKFAYNRKKSMLLEIERENREFNARMNVLKDNINSFVTTKRSFEDAGFNLKAGKKGDMQKLTPEHFGSSLKTLNNLYKYFDREKNEDMKNRTKELAADILGFLDKNADIKKSCGVAGEELKEITDTFARHKTEILPTK